jgi:hypothetical protein
MPSAPRSPCFEWDSFLRPPGTSKKYQRHKSNGFFSRNKCQQATRQSSKEKVLSGRKGEGLEEKGWGWEAWPSPLLAGAGIRQLVSYSVVDRAEPSRVRVTNPRNLQQRQQLAMSAPSCNLLMEAVSTFRIIERGGYRGNISCFQI